MPSQISPHTRGHHPVVGPCSVQVTCKIASPRFWLTRTWSKPGRRQPAMGSRSQPVRRRQHLSCPEGTREGRCTLTSWMTNPPLWRSLAVAAYVSSAPNGHGPPGLHSCGHSHRRTQQLPWARQSAQPSALSGWTPRIDSRCAYSWSYRSDPRRSEVDHPRMQNLARPACFLNGMVTVLASPSISQ
jgi:hypothetical protein